MQSDVGRRLGFAGEDMHFVARGREAVGGLPGDALGTSGTWVEALDRERHA